MKECTTIEVVTDEQFGFLDGIYEISEEICLNDPSNPVWKKPEDDYYIFNPGAMWMIGDHLDLQITNLLSQTYYFKGIYY